MTSKELTNQIFSRFGFLLCFSDLSIFGCRFLVNLLTFGYFYVKLDYTTLWNLATLSGTNVWRGR